MIFLQNCVIYHWFCGLKNPNSANSMFLHIPCFHFNSVNSSVLQITRKFPTRADHQGFITIPSSMAITIILSSNGHLYLLITSGHHYHPIMNGHHYQPIIKWPSLSSPSSNVHHYHPHHQMAIIFIHFIKWPYFILSRDHIQSHHQIIATILSPHD